jgi:hypothetical protein
MGKLNQYIEAVKESPNLLAMASVVTAAAAVGSVVPLLVGLVGEALYLVTVPDSNWYQRTLNERERAAKAKSFNETFATAEREILGELTSGLRERYQTLKYARDQVAEDAAGKEKWYEDVIRKLDHLLLAFLQFAQKEGQFREHLERVAKSVQPDEPAKKRKNNVNLDEVLGDYESPHADAPSDELEAWAKRVVDAIQEKYDREIAGVEARIQSSSAGDPNVAILQKRTEVIRRRAEYVAKMGRMMVNIHHQMRLLEDTFGLISDEVRARPPQEVLQDIEEVVLQTNLLSEAIDQFAPVEQLLANS